MSPSTSWERYGAISEKARTSGSVAGCCRGSRYPVQAKDVSFNPCGQDIGRATRVRKAKDVVYEMVEEYIEATERLQAGVPA